MASEGLVYRQIQEWRNGAYRKEMRIEGLGDNKDEVLDIPETHDGLPVTQMYFMRVPNPAIFDHVKVLRISKNVTGIIGLGHFRNIESFEIDPENKNYSVRDGCLYSGWPGLQHPSMCRYPPKRPDKHFVLPEGTDFDEGCFAYASNLETVTIDDNTPFIPQGAFANCTALKRIEIPPDVSEIRQAAFAGCDSLSEVVFKQDRRGDTRIYVIENGAFHGCCALTSFEIPSGCGEFDPSSLECSGLREIKGGCSGYQAVDGVLYATSLGGVHLAFYPPCRPAQGRIYVVPENVEYIDAPGFYQCESLRGLVLPVGIKEIDSCALPNEGPLKTIYYRGTAEQWKAIKKYNYEPRKLYFFSKKKPTGKLRYWHFVDGVPTPWETDAL